MDISTPGRFHSSQRNGSVLSILNLDNNINNSSLKICFWNIEGIFKFLKMEAKDIDLVLENHIICLYETWSESNYTLGIFNRYSIVNSVAYKCKERGRAKGGLSILFRNDIFKIDQTFISRENFIILRLFYKNNVFFAIVCVYIQPVADKDVILGELEFELQEYMIKFPDDYVIVGGDFNARIADLNEDTIREVVPNGNVKMNRVSMDKKCNK